ncbi:hypothetical protein [Virgibacillus doumboii]|uniref:hypothetical protein n=1 Tax=Virgibacillus doumboii TaxID=2697503 RepID=UPI0013DEAE1E|nr:hypothetical protein [Virgibacillus doumboii]
MTLSKRIFSFLLIVVVLFIGNQLSTVNTNQLSNSYTNGELPGTLGDDDLPPPLVPPIK